MVKVWMLLTERRKQYNELQMNEQCLVGT